MFVPFNAVSEAPEPENRSALAGFLTNRRARIVRTDDGRLAARLDDVSTL